MLHTQIGRVAGALAWASVLAASAVLCWTVPARAQPADPWAQPYDPEADEEGEGRPGDSPGSDAAEGGESAAKEAQPNAPGATAPGQADPADARAEEEAEEEGEEDDDEGDDLDEDEVAIVLPNIFNAATGRLLPAGLLYFSGTVDTGGGVSGEVRAGLGDVAEFGLEVSDLIRSRVTADESSERIWPYVLATFKMGIAEDQLFDAQPAMSLGFRKSFSREDGAYTTRVAELYLVGSKSLGSKVALHFGGSFWDASMEPAGGDPVFFHDRGWEKQLRAFGGIEIEPLEDAKILLETFWVPEFCYECSPNMKLTPNFAWGVRYEAADWVLIESGVRIPDIREVNLIDAQIFGQLTLVSRALNKALNRAKKRK